MLDYGWQVQNDAGVVFNQGGIVQNSKGYVCLSFTRYAVSIFISIYFSIYLFIYLHILMFLECLLYEVCAEPRRAKQTTFFHADDASLGRCFTWKGG